MASVGVLKTLDNEALFSFFLYFFFLSFSIRGEWNVDCFKYWIDMEKNQLFPFQWRSGRFSKQC